MADEKNVGVPRWGEGWQSEPAPEGLGGPHYGTMIETLRDFLDRVAAAAPDEATIEALAVDLRDWSSRLQGLAVPERDQFFSHRRDLPGRGQTMAPALFVDAGDAHTVRGHVTFGRYFLGGNGAVHGGALPLLFDEVLGRLANAGGRLPSRTAYLHVDYRSITPVGERLIVHGRFEREDGRKRFLRAELRHGDILCAEAEGLFIELKPGQP